MDGYIKYIQNHLLRIGPIYILVILNGHPWTFVTLMKQVFILKASAQSIFVRMFSPTGLEYQYIQGNINR